MASITSTTQEEINRLLKAGTLSTINGQYQDKYGTIYKVSGSTAKPITNVTQPNTITAGSTLAQQDLARSGGTIGGATTVSAPKPVTQTPTQPASYIGAGTPGDPIRYAYKLKDKQVNQALQSSGLTDEQKRIIAEAEANGQVNFNPNTNLQAAFQSVLAKATQPEVPKTLDSEFYSNLFTSGKSSLDIQSLVEAQSQARNSLMAALKPSEAVQSIRQEINAVKDQLRTLNTSTTAGLNKIGDQPIPLPLLIGQQESLLKQSEVRKQVLVDNTQSLVDQLGLEQEFQQAQIQAAQTGVEFAAQDLDFAISLEDKVYQREQQTLDRTRQFTQDQRNLLADIIESTAGFTYDELPPQIQQQIAQVAQTTGMPLGVVMSAMETTKQQMQFDQLIEASKLEIQQQESKTSALREQRLSTTSGSASSDKSLVDSVIANPQLFNQLTPTLKADIIPDLTKKGFQFPPDLSASQASILTAFTSAKQIIKEIGTLSNRLITADNALGAQVQGVKLYAGALAKTNTEAALLQSKKEGLLSLLVRALGEKGMLTNQDIARVRGLLPDFNDTKELAGRKISELSSMVEDIEKTNRDVIFGPSQQAAQNTDDRLGLTNLLK